MSPVIHMEIEQVRFLARLLDNNASDIFQASEQLRSQAARLEAAWQGSTADHFHNEFWRLQQTCVRQAEALQTLAQRLRHEVDEWECADQQGQKKWISQNNPDQQPDVVSADVPSSPKGVEKEFKAYEPLFDGTKLVLKKTKHIPYRQWRSVGRELNQWSGNLKAGWVGRMDDLGHTVHSPLISKGVPFGLGVASDLLSGDSLDRAIGSEVIETAFDMAIEIIPGINVAYGVYQTALTVGSVFAGVLQVIGCTEEAAWLQNTLDALDIGEHVGDMLYDFIAPN